MSAFSHVIEWSTFMPKYLLLPSDELAKEGQRFLKGLTAAEKGKTRCEGWKVTWIPARPHAPPSPPLNSLQMEWHDMSSNAVQQIHTYTNTYKYTHTNTNIHKYTNIHTPSLPLCRWSDMTWAVVEECIVLKAEEPFLPLKCSGKTGALQNGFKRQCRTVQFNEVSNSADLLLHCTAV